MEKKEPNELERNGIVQSFEFSIELGWRVMKDFLEFKGFLFKPALKDIFRLAQEAGFIKTTQNLIDGLDIRNELSHDYDGEKFEKYELKLRILVYPALENLYFYFKEQP